MGKPLHLKRMHNQRIHLEKENPDYFAHFASDNLLDFIAYIVAPEDSLYQHKLVKLHFQIPENYPSVGTWTDEMGCTLNLQQLTETSGTAPSHLHPT
ncbi:hypothetical protein F4778DRAFT_724366 [Xylariomycetidae sp. FL2044]|nr:hypothetical protein F4778DRAFT_724366 [Xylariomycetidae sp. FL2044]